MKRILILNGPNLNMLGVREPEIYGNETLDDIHRRCKKTANALDLNIDFRQSNHEGELVTWIQEERSKIDGIIINAGAYTHTSVAIYDALRLLECPIIEVHITNPKEREAFRHHSYIEALAKETIAGQGPKGYEQALKSFVSIM